MSILGNVTTPLVGGERLSREEFLRRWDRLPDLKRAELIGGIVYLPSPLSRAHARLEPSVSLWLAYYDGFTPGSECLANGTWLMLDDAPQPDCALRVLPEYGGQSRMEGDLCAGAPELVVEVSASSQSYDLGPKMRLYQKAGVLDYISVLVGERRVVWRRLISGGFAVHQPDEDGIGRSVVF